MTNQVLIENNQISLFFVPFRITDWNGVYGEGKFAGNVAFPYIVAINNISQFTAMYCLVMFYQANKVIFIAPDLLFLPSKFQFFSFVQLELRPMKPLPKFLCIKAVVFFSFL